jgi:hypothetical protein
MPPLNVGWEHPCRSGAVEEPPPQGMPTFVNVKRAVKGGHA